MNFLNIIYVWLLWWWCYKMILYCLIRILILNLKILFRGLVYVRQIGINRYFAPGYYLSESECQNVSRAPFIYSRSFWRDINPKKSLKAIFYNPMKDNENCKADFKHCHSFQLIVFSYSAVYLITIPLHSFIRNLLCVPHNREL